jgi:hypothetical protein
MRRTVFSRRRDFDLWDDELEEHRLGQRRSALRSLPATRPVADMANEGLKKSLVYDRLSFLLYD